MICTEFTPLVFAEYAAVALAVIFIIAVPLLRYLDGPSRERKQHAYLED